jgi:DNA-binding response OmpR family regulator
VSQPRVLIIDDDDLVAVALYEHLVTNGVAVDLATDPARAQTLMNGTDYALIVMDAYLTGLLHGRATDLLERVHRTCPGARIILLSAYGSEQLARAVASVHDIIVLAKPQPVIPLGELIDGFLHHGTVPQPQAK